MNKKRNKNKSDLNQDELRKLLGLENDAEYVGNFSSEEMSEIMSEMEEEELTGEWDDFDEMMISIPEYLRYLREFMKEKSLDDSFDFDFGKDINENYKSRESFSDNALKLIEKAFIEASEGQSGTTPEIDELVMATALFLGEAAVDRLEGEWLIWDRRGDVDYGKPVVAFWVNDDYGLKLNPFETVLLLLEERIDNTLAGSLNAIDQALAGQ